MRPETALPHIAEPNHGRLIIRAIADKLRPRNRRRPKMGLSHHLHHTNIIARSIFPPETPFGMFHYAQIATGPHPVSEQTAEWRQLWLRPRVPHGQACPRPISALAHLCKSVRHSTKRRVEDS